MSKTLTATQLANLTGFEVFELFNDFNKVTVRFQNYVADVTAPFSVKFEDKGATITVHSEIHGPFEILSPRYNNLYMHNISMVRFS